MTFHLVHWINEGAWDVYDEIEATRRIPEEFRFEGALGMMTWKDGNAYLGKVIKISDKTTVEKEETRLSLLIEKEKKSLPSRRSRKVKSSSSTATERQVSKALGEWPKLTPEQMETKKAEQLKKKAIEEAQEKEEARQDHALIRNSVSRNLIDKFDPKPANPPANVDVLSDDDVALDNEMDHDSGGDNPMGDSVIAHSHSSDDSDMDEEYHQKDEIDEFKNPVTVSFLQFLLKKFGSPAATKTSDDQQFAQPITNEGQKMVRLVKGHSLKISKGGRNILEIDTKSKKNPSVFTRKTLTQLYGNNLDSITAMGRKKGSICISDEDKSAIYDFVVMQCNAKSFPWTTFIRCMTKKCSAAKSPKEKKPKSKEKKDSESKQKADKSDPKEQEQPSKWVAHTTAPEEAAKQTVRASPMKFQRNIIVEELNTEHTHQKSLTLLENSTNQISSWQQQGSQNSEGFHGQSSGPQLQQGQSEELQVPHGQAAELQPAARFKQAAGFQAQSPVFQGQSPVFQGQAPVFQGQAPVFHGQAPAPGFQGQPAGFQGQAAGWAQDQWGGWYRWPPQEAQANHYNY